MKKSIISMMLAAALPVVAWAQSEVTVDGIKLSVGASYRNFRQVRFQNSDVPSFKAFLDKTGTLQDYSKVQDYVNAELGTAGLSSLPVTVLQYEGGKSTSHSGYGHEESLGFTLGAAATLWQDEQFTLDAVANFQYFAIQSAAKGAFSGNSSAYTEYYFTGSSAGAYTDPSDVAYNFRGSYRSRFNLDLFVFDAGLSLGYNAIDNLSLYLAGGPTFSIADMESSSYAAVGSDALKIAAHRTRKNEIEFEFGLYAAVGAAYQLNESYGVAAEFRYDEAFGTVGTRVAKQDLDGWGGMIKFLINF